MERQLIQAYDTLVPADQLVIDAMISSLYKKDKQIRDLTDEFLKTLPADQAAAEPTSP